MTPERAKELLPVIQAYADGKEVEHRQRHHVTWAVVQSPVWADFTDYRIKSEVPCYRLFKRWDGYVVAKWTGGKYDKAEYERIYSSLSGRWITDWIPCPAINED